MAAVVVLSLGLPGGGIYLLRAPRACLFMAAPNGHAAVVAACPLLRDELT